jgi:hypothetical protein
MAGYNTIRGLRVKYLSADPAASEAGQVWYNSTTGNLRLDGIALAGTWSAANPCNTGRRFFQGCGSQTNGIMAGGFAPGASPPMFNQTEEFDGTNFTNGGNLGAATYTATMFGPGTATVFAGGGDNVTPLTATQHYNGTAWSSPGNNLPDGRSQAGGCGTQAAGVLFGGKAPSANMTATLEYNGSWTAVPGTLNVGRRSLYGSGTGTQTACITASGNAAPGISNASETYNGTIWTSTPNLNTAREAAMMNAEGSTSSAFVAGGEPGAPASTATEIYDGSSWTTSGTLGTARSQSGSGGTGSAMWVAAGDPTSPSNTPSSRTAETFTGPSIITKNLSVS